MDEFVNLYIYTMNTLPKKGVCLLAEISAPHSALLFDVIRAVETKNGLTGGSLFCYDVIPQDVSRRTRRTPLDCNLTLAQHRLISGSVLLYSDSSSIKSPVFATAKRKFDEDE